MSNQQLFGRDWLVNVDGHVIQKPMRVQLHVKKTSEKEPNTCDLIISNLSADTRKKMKAKGMQVSVEAGYKDTRAVVFSGASRICDHTHEGPEWLTKIQCGDGEQAYQFTRFSKSWDGGVSAKTVILDVADGLDLNKGNLETALNNIQLPIQSFGPGFAAHGNAFQLFDRLLKSVGLTFSVQQGALLVAEKNKAPIQEVVVLSAKTGLLGSPQHSPPTQSKKYTSLVFKALLNSKIRPGVTVRMDSLQVKGDFIPLKVEHTGDSHGELWVTHVEAISSSTKTNTL